MFNIILLHNKHAKGDRFGEYKNLEDDKIGYLFGDLYSIKGELFQLRNMLTET